jgi:hypothetical protein
VTGWHQTSGHLRERDGGVVGGQSKTYREKYQQQFFLKTVVDNIFINNGSQQEPMWIV